MARVDSNVVYGMYSGLALLMDVHYPERPNGLGIVVVAGSGWHAPLSYDATPLKARPPEAAANGRAWTPDPLRDAGYTVFTVNHRAAPRFRYPAAVEDVQRAVRYVRHHAADFAIDPDRIGATGNSSGGHLVSMLGVLDGDGDPDDPDPVNRESARVQCVVAGAAPSDLLRFIKEPVSGRDAVASFLGTYLAPVLPPSSIEYRTYQEASPISYVSKDSSPFLLMHGDADEVVPFEQAEVMEHALRDYGVEVKLIRVEGGGHGPDFRGPGYTGAAIAVDFLGEMVGWFNQHLQKTVGAAAR